MQPEKFTRNDEPEKIFKIAQTYFQEIVAPQAERIDRHPEALKEALQGMGERSLLGLRIPPLEQESGLSDLHFYQFQILVTQYSGALAFLQTQHQSAAAMLAACENNFLKQAYLPHMSTGEIMLGVGFSQLRRSDRILLRATETRKGYYLEGEIPWITGFGFFKEFIVGASSEDGQEIYGIVPLQDFTQESGGTINLSAPMELTAMASTNTVSAKLRKWFLDKDLIVSVRPAGSIAKKDRQNVLNHGFFALGCTQAGLNILENTYYKKKLFFIQKTFLSLNQELIQCRNAMFSVLRSPNCAYEHKLNLRAKAIALAGRCSQAAVVACGGAANHSFHPAQRVYREALLFALSGQTTDVMEETLKEIAFARE
ncbi:MAG: acyl-CoA dehydrogenase family protein [Xenococcaceae cyanobacterium]